MLERVGTGEQVLVVMNELRRPEDLTCEAITKAGTQCTKTKHYDHYWSRFCKTHKEADDKARASGKPRVRHV